jgi:spermidine synthase
MELWFSERFRESTQLSFQINCVLYQKRSQFQDVVVLDTIPFGRMLVLDGCVMTTEKDEFVYHEMISHIGLLAHPNPKTVCIIGGGDGGTVREVLKHSSVEHIVLAEIDEDVVNVCKEFFPALANDLNNPRVEVKIADGIKYLENQKHAFDAILSDSTDPIGPGAVLFEDSYFGYAKRALKEGGFFVTQCESAWTNPEGLHDYAERMRKHFHRVFPYGASIPTYPSGYWNFLIGSDTIDPRVCSAANRQNDITKSTRYYTAAHQLAAFVVPAFIRGN